MWLGSEDQEIPLNVVFINETDYRSSNMSHIPFYPCYLSARPANTTCINADITLVEPMIARSQNVQYCNVSRRSRSNSFQLLGLTAFNSFASTLILFSRTGNSRSGEYSVRSLGTATCSKRVCAQSLYSGLSPLRDNSRVFLWRRRKSSRDARDCPKRSR